MAAKQNRTTLYLAGGAAAVAGYQFLVKPWLAARSLAAAGGGGSLLPSLLPSVTTPTMIGPNPSVTGQIPGSIVDPRVSPGGDVGQAMWRKNWTQAYATQRLNAIKAAAAEAVAKLAQLRAPGAMNAQAAALVAQGKVDLAQLQNIAANDRLNETTAKAAGDAAGAAAWGQAAAQHEAQANQLAARITATAAGDTNQTAAAIAAFEGALANQKADYLTLTGLQLAV